MLGIPFVVAVLVAVIRVAERPADDGITRAAACKAAALSLTTAEMCREEAETERSLFAASDQRQWYVKYMDYLYRQEMLSVEMTPPTAGTAEGNLTYEEAAYLAERWSETEGRSGEKERLLDIVRMTRENRKKAIPADRWWELYGVVCGFAGKDGEGSAGQEGVSDGAGEADGTGAARVAEEILQIGGTPDNAEGAAPWTAYTDQGVYGFEGLGLSAYIDCRIRVLARDHEIIRVLGVVSEEAVYRNVWIISASGDSLTGFTGDFTRSFALGQDLENAGELEGQLADIRMAGGKTERISLKREKITAKVLSVREDAIELEGYGLIPLDEDFCVYKTYGEPQLQDISQILVGYDTQEFVVGDGKLCAALIVRSFGAETIRVLVMDTGFRSIFHPEIRLEFLSDGVMRQGERETVFHAGESVTVRAQADEAAEDGSLVLAASGERLQFIPFDESAGIRAVSVERNQGAPVCPGKLEIACGEEGLVLINELYLEDYLKRVLPSEMPLEYEKEALKAQAVCARTYAYRQIRGNAYRQYGAHVDDSTNYQVYNNSETGKAAAEAVDATYGQLLMYGDDAAETYYFSTSCGYTTDMTVWGQEAERTPYLRSVAVSSGSGAIHTSGRPGEEADGTDEEAFEAFIRTSGADDYESSCAMYRWQTQITGAQLEEKIPNVGEITQVAGTGRAAGGAALCLTVTGTNGTEEFRGESRIRAVLGHPDAVITRGNGSTTSGLSSLPSAFISVACSRTESDGGLVCSIYGGGYGHGIGMSQNGAQAMAKRGWSYEEILEFFYEGTRLEIVY